MAAPAYLSLELMDRWVGCVALVTGASSGIGHAICRELVKYGVTTIGIARNAQKIQALAREEKVDKCAGHLFGFECDLTNEEDIRNVFKKIKEDFGRIDICINNAGCASITSLMNGHTDDWRNMMEVNVLALCVCTRETLKLMKERHVSEGIIIHIAGMEDFQMPNADIGFYNATKTMVRSLAESLRQELKAAKSRVRVATITPGLVQSGFAEHMYEDGGKARELYSTQPTLLPADVAECVAYILYNSSRVEINDIVMKPFEQHYKFLKSFQ